MKIALAGIEKTGLVKLMADGTITASDFAADGKNPIEGILGPSWKTFTVLMDFAAVSYIDSSAIGWLIGTQKMFREGGGGLAVYHLQPAVKQVLDLLKVGRLVPLCENEEAARAAIGART
ncbi:MAG TPA: STAS domain-containing protein [Tepidisphaeraceae bacterium]|jgi:anti-anti-sigma factor